MIAVLVGFWVLYAAAAFGYELRNRKEEALPVSSWLLLFASSTLIVGMGYVRPQPGRRPDRAGRLDLRLRRRSPAARGRNRSLRLHREIGSLLIGGGIGLASFGLAHAFDGPTVVAAWAAMAAALAYMATRVDASPTPTLSNAERLLMLAYGFLILAAGHMLLVEAPPMAIAEGVDDLGSSLVAIASCAGAALACWYFGREIEPKTATVLGFVSAAGFVYLGSVAIIDAIGADDSGEAREIGQAWLSAFWAATGSARSSGAWCGSRRKSASAAWPC